MRQASITRKKSSGVFSSMFLVLILSLGACGGGSTGTGGGTGSPGGGGGPATSSVLYVASGSNGAGEILAFAVNASTGALATPASFPAPQLLNELKVDPSGKFLYGSDFDAGAVRVYAVDPSTGALSEVAGSPFSAPQVIGNGGPLAVSPNGKFLFFSNSTGSITTFAISTATLTPNGIAVQDQNQPDHFAVDPSGNFLYVANHSDENEGDQFSVFAIDQMSGALSAVAGSPFGFQGNSQPAGIAVHPNGNFLYSTLSNSGEVEGMAVARASGALSLISGSPWKTMELIPNFTTIAPSGSYLYVSTAGLGAIQAFSIDASSGGLTAVATYTGGNPTYMVFDPAGKHLYTTWPSFHQVAMFTIDAATGELSGPVEVPADSDTGALAIVQLP
jgi:6-phosphogluconolactonase